MVNDAESTGTRSEPSSVSSDGSVAPSVLVKEDTPKAATRTEGFEQESQAEGKEPISESHAVDAEGSVEITEQAEAVAAAAMGKQAGELPTPTPEGKQTGEQPTPTPPVMQRRGAPEQDTPLQELSQGDGGEADASQLEAVARQLAFAAGIIAPYYGMMMALLFVALCIQATLTKREKTATLSSLLLCQG